MAGEFGSLPYCAPIRRTTLSDINHQCDNVQDLSVYVDQ